MKILLLAGEESGAMYAEQIAEAVCGKDPSAEIRGYGDAGFEIADLAVIGFFAVLRKAFFFLRVKRTMERMIDEWRPDVVCTVDYPGMNLKLAAYAKRRGVRTVHVVCPQVWAWKKGRIPKIEASLDKLCCFFPFEPKLFKPGFAEFVGHPLVDEMGRRDQGEGIRDQGSKLLAILPGSRMGEIEKHLPTLLKVVEMLQAETPDLKVVIPAANERAHAAIVSRVSRLMSSPGAVEIRLGGARETLRSATAAVVASGTATLEAAIAGCPTVLVYRVGWLFAAIMRLLIRGVRHLGLANIIAEKAGIPCPMPELLQENFTAEGVRDLIRPLLTDAAANAAARKALSETMARLGSGGDSITKIAHILV